MSEFGDRQLALGSLTGIRSFKVDRLGRLTGVSYPEVWKPGVNHARCSRMSRPLDPYSYLAAAVAGFGVMDVQRAMRRKEVSSPPVSLTKKPQHRAGEMPCSCGYYAYFDRGHNPHHNGAQVEGIVQGHGVTTVGSRGFRAERAEIVALIKPGRVRRGDRPLDGLAARCYGAGPAVAGVGFAAAFVGFIFGVAGTTQWGPLATPAFLLPIIGALMIYLGFRSIDVHFDGEITPRLPFDLVQANYPDVPVFRSRRAAMRAFPLTPPPPPVAPTPSTDPNFWTREAL